MEKHSMLKLKRKIERIETLIKKHPESKKELNDKIKKYKNWINEKKEKTIQDIQIPQVQRLKTFLKNNPRSKCYLQRGLSYIIIYSPDDKVHKCKLKYQENYGTQYQKTHQYKTMDALGFKTKDGRTYYHNGELGNIWVQFLNSKINKLSINGYLIESIRIHLTKEYKRKPIFTKGLTQDDRRIQKQIK